MFMSGGIAWAKSVPTQTLAFWGLGEMGCFPLWRISEGPRGPREASSHNSINLREMSSSAFPGSYVR